jgi:hypothetical protein
MEPQSTTKAFRNDIMRPSEYMRSRRPYLFSDSEIVSTPTLTRELLDHQLETLTNRKEENEFEHLCRRLAEKEICPNLRPQTGPTGGGDSKVDSETYPVSTGIAQSWYDGEDTAAHELWGFAFSAKRDWRAKARSDIKGIKSTGRPYRRIYFITNQYVRDKVRPQVEAQLTKIAGCPVHIFDRTWILECVFNHDRVALAVETLNLDSMYLQTGRRAGPGDVRREAELAELDRQIEDAERYRGVEYQLAQDCLEAALLARGLERPRTEVDGRFARAERIAPRVNYSPQRLRIAYAEAWTAVWWHDDFAELNRIYDEVEGFAHGSAYSADLQLVVNLWNLVLAAVRRGALTEAGAKFQARTETLRAALQEIADDRSRPNNALEARTDLLLMRLQQSADAEEFDAVLGELKGVVEKIEGLGDYPAKSLADSIQALGDFVSDSPAYSELFEATVALMERRSGEGSAGRALLERGFQLLKAERYYDAIRLLGRAQHKLVKYEYRGHFVMALTACGSAYEQAGLLWAARANFLAAATTAFADFLEHGDITRSAMLATRQLSWLEIQLGRVPAALQWARLTDIVGGHLILQGKAKESFEQQRRDFDMILGLLLLRCKFDDLKSVGGLPNVLDALGFDHARIALLYALGHEDALRQEGWIPEIETPEAVKHLMVQWTNQPAREQVASHPVFLDNMTTMLTSNVIGCEVKLTTPNNLEAIFLAETLLAALEAFLATSLNEGVYPYRSTLEIRMRPDSFDVGEPTITAEVASEGAVEITYPRDLRFASIDARNAFKSSVLRAIAVVMFQIAAIPDAEKYLHRLGEEGAFSRALDFSDIAIWVERILGSTPKLSLSDWEKEYNGLRFVARRKLAWDHDVLRAEAEKATSKAEGPPDLERMPHRARSVLSVIDIPVWDKAHWHAAIYAGSDDPRQPPILALGFKDQKAGVGIFEGWRARQQKTRETDFVRVAILTGIDKPAPYAYAMIIGAEVPAEAAKALLGGVLTVSRIQHMNPSNPKNLNTFLEAYRRLGRYVMVPAVFTDASKPPRLLMQHRVMQRNLVVRPAWQISEYDPDIVGLSLENDPIIPDGVTDPPVHAALKRVRSRRGI